MAALKCLVFLVVLALVHSQVAYPYQNSYPAAPVQNYYPSQYGCVYPYCNTYTYYYPYNNYVPYSNGYQNGYQNGYYYNPYDQNSYIPFAYGQGYNNKPQQQNSVPAPSEKSVNTQEE